MSSFDVKLFGKLTSFVGWNIIQRPEGIKIDQRGYVKQVLKDHNMETANATRTPLPKDANVLPAGEFEKTLDVTGHKKYRSLVGSLMYLAVCTRPDISFSVAVLARQVHAPTARHLALVKRILRYVAGTVDVGLLYPRSVPVKARSFRAYVDADWGGCKETRKSTSGWIIVINDAPIVWRSRKQSVVSTSSGEAEYVALFDCIKHVTWMRKFFWEMSSKKPWPENEINLAPSIVSTDSLAAKALAMNKQVSARGKAHRSQDAFRESGPGEWFHNPRPC